MDGFQNVVKKLQDAMPEPLKEIQQDVDKNVHEMVQSYLHRMDLVTREEFDIQKAVLLKTRKKVEELEKVVEELKREIEAKG